VHYQSSCSLVPLRNFDVFSKVYPIYVFLDDIYRVLVLKIVNELCDTFDPHDTKYAYLIIYVFHIFDIDGSPGHHLDGHLPAALLARAHIDLPKGALPSEVLLGKLQVVEIFKPQGLLP
jgi:hypothetical protein